MKDFAGLVYEELAEAEAIHEPMNSLHEAYAVILEEVDELWDEVRKRRIDRSLSKILTELVQIGAMAQRAAKDLGLLG